MANSRAILLPVEDTEESVRALDWVLKEFYREGDVLHLLHVIAVSRPFGSGLFSSAEPCSPLDSSENAEALESEHARAWMLNRLVSVAADAEAIAEVSLMTTSGSKGIGEAICRKAEEIDAVLLVMTANKNGGAAAFYEGSHIQHCIQNSNTTVLVWRPD